MFIVISRTIIIKFNEAAGSHENFKFFARSFFRLHSVCTRAIVLKCCGFGGKEMRWGRWTQWQHIRRGKIWREKRYILVQFVVSSTLRTSIFMNGRKVARRMGRLKRETRYNETFTCFVRGKSENWRYVFSACLRKWNKSGLMWAAQQVAADS